MVSVAYDGRYAQALHLMVCTPNRPISRSALQIVEFGGRHSASLNWTVCIPNPSMSRFAFPPAKVNHGHAVPFMKVRTDVLRAAIEELQHFATERTMRAEETTLILTGDFGLTRQSSSATVQKFNKTNSWRDWQMKATIEEFPGDLIYVKNCITREWDVQLGRDFEERERRSVRSAVTV